MNIIPNSVSIPLRIIFDFIPNATDYGIIDTLIRHLQRDLMPRHIRFQSMNFAERLPVTLHQTSAQTLHLGHQCPFVFIVISLRKQISAHFVHFVDCSAISYRYRHAEIDRDLKEIESAVNEHDEHHIDIHTADATTEAPAVVAVDEDAQTPDAFTTKYEDEDGQKV